MMNQLTEELFPFSYEGTNSDLRQCARSSFIPNASEEKFIKCLGCAFYKEHRLNPRHYSLLERVRLMDKIKPMLVRLGYDPDDIERFRSVYESGFLSENEFISFLQVYGKNK